MTSDQAMRLVAVRAAARLRHADLEENTGFIEQEVSPDMGRTLDEATGALIRMLEILAGS